ncbi:MAG TPA: cag pathogenicity island protein [Candidatus Eisenbergiella pullistercoris]|uniref:Cag pathogenicity island protein n=1 Tax=Candidatus Eisenbergiella pullistercoris TaxID=2838555 RepID=A0A9D2C5V9_9FIRM|nr:cag pathogenicity island protein [Candidatus Eisenbergiella pullistercoris]
MGSIYTEAQKEATKKYLSSLKNLSIRVKPEEADRLKNEANRRNMSLRSFILLAVNEKIEREAKK